MKIEAGICFRVIVQFDQRRGVYGEQWGPGKSWVSFKVGDIYIVVDERICYNLFAIKTMLHPEHGICERLVALAGLQDEDWRYYVIRLDGPPPP